jgi:tripartite ATP-independent transporter DctM subunit
MSASLFMLIVFIVAMLIRIPITISMGIGGLAGLIYMGNVPWMTIIQQMGAGFYSFEFLAIPFFILTAEVMNQGEITDKIFGFSQDVVGWIHGGLAQVTVVASAIFAGIQGSMAADCAGLGKVIFTAMTQKGYRKPFTVGIILAAATLGPMIPPSIMGVLYAVTAGTSVGKQLLAGLVPGIIIAFSLMVYVYFTVKTKREFCPIAPKPTIRQLGKSFRSVFPALLTPVILLFGIVSGIVSPTEAGVLACVYCLFIGFLSKGLKIKDFPSILTRTVFSSCLIMFIIGISMIMGWIVTREQIPIKLMQWLTGMTNNKYVILILINSFLLVLGCLIETAPALLLSIPVLLPVINAVNIDPLHFGEIIIFNLLIGMITPPVGLGLYIMCSITDVPFESVVKGSLPFYIPLLVSLGLITYIPELSTFLPNLLMP